MPEIKITGYLADDQVEDLGGLDGTRRELTAAGYADALEMTIDELFNLKFEVVEE